MADTLDQVALEYDVFIIYASCDEKKAHYICESLERHDEKFRCLAQFKSEAFKPGKPLFESIVECIAKSHITLLVVTGESFSTSWVSLETILALEHSVVRNQLTLRLLLCDVKESALGFLKKGPLENVPEISISFNKNDWLEALVASIQKRIEIPELLPVGCLAHGQVFSHFIGYLVYLLPKLEEKIKDLTIYTQHQSNFSTKLLMLVPGSCDLPATLDKLESEAGTRIEAVDSLQFTALHAGKTREIYLQIYRARRQQEEYFFIADLPSVLRAIHRIHNDGLAKVDLKFQAARFYYTMNEVLNHFQNVACANKVTLVLFNDKVEHIADAVFQAVRDDVMFNMSQMNMPVPDTTVLSFSAKQKCNTVDVLICCGDDPKDIHIAHEIGTFLERHKKKVEFQGGGKSYFSGLSNQTWVIFVLSQASLAHEVMVQCLSVLIYSIEQNQLCTLPVLVDLQPKDLPQAIQWVTLVSTRETNYMERLLQTINGGVIRVHDRLPSGDVATGLSWAYVLNYLILTLLTKSDKGQDFSDRIKALLYKKELSCGCIPKLFLLVPKSCRATEDLAKEANQGGLHQCVEMVDPLEPVTINKRKYKLYMYKYTSPSTGLSVCFVCEYSTPINCLHEMANQFPFAGLHKEDMYRQRANFVTLFPTIVSREAVKKKLGDVSEMVHLIDYDDESGTLLSALEKALDPYMKDSTQLVYSASTEMMELD